ncbi:hypothetical protein BCD67_21610 [Oscillatoriales cyanobacterium USR001]|nr:hypothetical protein BCD67_21610 [Oscillatoriales cyanobacterium USR001]
MPKACQLNAKPLVRQGLKPRAVSFSNFSRAKILNENIKLIREHASIQLSIWLSRTYGDKVDL